ncbi:Uncharacterised protein [Pseudomonas fluorescens]|uniref:Uncharacterized protein n=1 Tax=Pseudomonas fluorescens TaxID=294 RepID=A0A448DMM9_PSEFL|nr:hypothetical protein [Pseudomonas fluorescens]VEF07966.1 Uncharacterised protein [Pseudomonas fluorescens]
MKLRKWIDGWRFVLLAVIAVALLRWSIECMQDDFEIALTINEPWEQMSQRSFAAVGPAPANAVWTSKSRSGVRLRFIDPEFGFVTPLARDFRIIAKSNDLVGRVRLSPQMTPLSLDEALIVVSDLRDQLRNKCWVEAKVMDDPPIADTLQWRTWFHSRTEHAMSFWLAADKYQLQLDIEPWRMRTHKTDPRYRVVLMVDEPFLPFANAASANGCVRSDSKTS